MPWNCPDRGAFVQRLHPFSAEAAGKQRERSARDVGEAFCGNDGVHDAVRFEVLSRLDARREGLSAQPPVNGGAEEADEGRSLFPKGSFAAMMPMFHLWFTDRRKDVIKTGGENVASIGVEKAIYAADKNIAEAVVIGPGAMAQYDRGRPRECWAT